MKKILITLLFFIITTASFSQNFNICGNKKIRPHLTKSVKYHNKIQKDLFFTKFSFKNEKTNNPVEVSISKTIPKRKKYSFRIR